MLTKPTATIQEFELMKVQQNDEESEEEILAGTINQLKQGNKIDNNICTEYLSFTNDVFQNWNF